MAQFAKFAAKMPKGASIGGMNTFTGNVAVASVLGLIGGIFWRNTQYNEQRNVQKANSAAKKAEDAWEAAYVAQRAKAGLKMDPAQESFEIMLQVMGDKFKTSDTAAPNGKPLNANKN